MARLWRRNVRFLTAIAVVASAGPAFAECRLADAVYEDAARQHVVKVSGHAAMPHLRDWAPAEGIRFYIVNYPNISTGDTCAEDSCLPWTYPATPYGQYTEAEPIHFDADDSNGWLKADNAPEWIRLGDTYLRRVCPE